ncbi:MAG: type II toxin-antitoxin system RelE/ParE family toxin, partial [Bacteroidales bacterium]|nr:type II toxin-antitoxin system RelE/ParE family toxin [Bacteroidales bacterium]
GISKSSKLHTPMAKYHLTEYVEIHPGLYRRSCHTHLIFYRLVENGDIEIVRILHERMDIASKFK